MNIRVFFITNISFISNKYILFLSDHMNVFYSFNIYLYSVGVMPLICLKIFEKYNGSV